jgi:hypothetical protein
MYVALYENAGLTSPIELFREMAEAERWLDALGSRKIDAAT